MQACIPGFNCPTPIEDGLFDYCVFNPQAPGCYVSEPLPIPINPLNDGEFPMWSLLDQCYSLSSGGCQGDFLNGILQSSGQNSAQREKNWLERCLESDDPLWKQIGVCAAAGVLGYTIGLVLYNYSIGEEENLVRNFNPSDALNNAQYGAVLCGLNWAISSFPKLIEYGQKLEFSLSTRAFAYGYIGAVGYSSFNLAGGNRTPGNHEFELSAWLIFGALNIFSLCGGLPGAILTTAVNTFASLVGNALDSSDWHWSYPSDDNNGA